MRPGSELQRIRIPELDGLEATPIILSRFPAVKIIMLTTFDDDDYVFQAIRRGASSRGY
ncbi:MAG: DNA-binding response regulator [Spirochaetaceae bacterium]|nr:MAG: DNA-binding response regulator [Spirochaetaceae bacterium]